jgi:hypothetical protein
MARFLLLFCALAIGGIATLIYLDAAHFDSSTASVMQNDALMATAVPTKTISAPPDTDRQQRATLFAQNVKIVATKPAAVAREITAKTVARWVAETTDEDPAVRSAAIDALSDAPKAKALPALLLVMRSGDDGDRQLAMDSMHTLALEQGDDNDEIRTVLRLVIYDGEEEAMISNAQIALEDIEYDIAASPIAARHSKAGHQRK